MKIEGVQRKRKKYSLKGRIFENIGKTCLQYMMLKAPVITSGARDFAPALSSTLSMMNIAMTEVKAIVI